jgi:DnaJ family protein C protein 28
MSWFELIADRKIRDAMEEGRFDDLPGKGKPLNLDVDLSVPPEQRMAMRLMREANLLPDWIQLDKEIRQRQERIRTKTEAYAQRREADLERAGDQSPALRLVDGRRDDFLIYAAKELRDLNRAIDRFNLIVPALSRQRLRLKLPTVLAELEERFPRIHPLLGDTMPWREIIREERPPTRLSNRMPVRRRKESFG